jgi:ABC-type uncharacterized transport system permease subunit
VSIAILFWVLCSVYLIGWLLFCLSFFRVQETVHTGAVRLLGIGLVLQLAYIVSGYLTLQTFLFDSLSGLLSFLSLLLILLYFILNRFFPNQIFGVIFTPLIILFLLLSEIISDHLIVTQFFLEESPIFSQFLLIVHASFSMLGYLLFGIAGLTSVFFLYQEQRIKNKTLLLAEVKVPSLGLLGTLIFKLIMAGFLFLTVGLLVGVSMQLAAYEGNPQLSLRQLIPGLTWGVYALFLIDRSISGLRGRISAVWAIIGFMVAVTSFIYEISILLEQQS